MDSNTGGILGIFGFIFSAAGMIYAAINHKRIRCRCCGKDVDVSVDVDSTVAPVDKEEEVVPEGEVVPEEAPPENVAVPVQITPPRKKKRLPPLPPRISPEESAAT